MNLLIVLLVLGILWAIVTCVGHASWVCIRYLLVGPKDDGTPIGSRPDLRSDLQATDRVVTRLIATGLLDARSAGEIRAKLSELANPKREWARPAAEKTPQRPNAESATPIPPSAPPRTEPKRPETQHPNSGPPQLRSQPNAHPVAMATIPVASRAPGEPLSKRPEPQPIATASEPNSARKTLSEIIHSFLADHNIRWGELVAGMLIVICSIGLIISLWNTLLSKHRAIPSLIFLATNAGIFGVGLYTLSRWKLRHTSRAMLVIATLLVPLGIMAGLAAAGKDARAVAFGDPITLATVLGVGAVYGTLLWFAGKALVGRRDGFPLALSVAGPACLLPLTPTLIRSLNPTLASPVLLGSAALTVALFWLIWRGRHSKAKTLGIATGQHRILTMALGAFSQTALVLHVAYQMGETPDRWRSIAIFLLPAWSSLAATAGTLVHWKKRPRLAVAGAAIQLLSIGMIVASLPISLESPRWLWTWASLASVSFLFIGFADPKRRLVPLAIVPAGIATVMSASLWSSPVAWQDLWFWQRIVNVESMIAASGVGVASLALSGFFLSDSNRRTTRQIAWGFLATSALTAIVLTFAPQSWSGTLAWANSVLLAFAAATCLFSWKLPSKHLPVESIRGRHAIFSSAIVFLVVFWFSVFHPITLPSTFAPLKTWWATSLAVILSFGAVIAAARPTCPDRLLKNWQIALSIACGATALFSFSLANSDWTASFVGFLVITFIAFAFAMDRKSQSWLHAAQLSSVAAALVIGYARFNEHLFAWESWKNLQAPFAWTILTASLAVFWLLVRRGFDHVPQRTYLLKRSRWLRGTIDEPERSLDGWMVIAVACFVTVAGVQTVATRLFSVLGENMLSSATSLGPAVVAIVCVATLLLLADRYGKQFVLPLATICGVGLGIWGCDQFAIRMSAEPQIQLVIGTTLACLGMTIGAWQLGQRTASNIALASCLAYVVTSAGVLLQSGWLAPVLRDSDPEVFPTVTVAVWSAIGAITCGLLASRRSSAPYAHGSTLFVGLLVFLLVSLVDPSGVAAWIQWAVLALLAWSIVMDQRWKSRWVLRESCFHAYLPSVVIGVFGALLTTIGVLLEQDANNPFVGTAGFVLAGSVAASLWLPVPGRKRSRSWETFAPTLPIIATLFAGHAAILLSHLSYWGLPPSEWLLLVWLACGFGSLIRCTMNTQRVWVDFGHVIAIFTLVITSGVLQSGGMFDAGCGVLAACGAASLPIFLSGWKRNSTIGNRVWARVTVRLLTWYGLAAGSFLLVRWCAHWPQTTPWPWTIVSTWLGGWILLWRLTIAERAAPSHPRSRTLGMDAAIETSFVLAVLLVVELVVSLVLIEASRPLSTWLSSTVIFRMTVALIASFSILFRPRKTSGWCFATATLVATVMVLTVHLGQAFLVDFFQTLGAAMITGAATITMLSFSIRPLSDLSEFVSKTWTQTIGFRSPEPLPTRSKHRTAVLRIARGIWIAMGVTSIAFMGIGALAAFWQNQNPNLPLLMGSIAMLAVAAIELANYGGPKERSYRRYVTLTLVLCATFLLASVGVSRTAYPLLTLTMRWYVASIASLVAFTFALPRLLPESLVQTWNGVLRSGRNFAGFVAIATLAWILVQEGMIRTQGDPTLIEKPLVLGVAIILAAASLLSTLAAVLSNPGSRYQTQWQFSDSTRRGLVIGAQMLGGLTWFHLFLCKSPLADLGLRAYWPYVVMALAFGSVGITQWAARRGDSLIEHTMKQTSLYLPLVPVLGFWLSLSLFHIAGNDSTVHDGWAYVQGKVSYQSLLLVGALYYTGLSLLWKNAIPRVASVLLGNAALWVMLTQSPDWSFLSHPQLWLIPPAASVLIVTQLNRRYLPEKIVSAIRYASTLVIYVSSTADMLLNGIGSTIAGPIVLVCLALVGMFAGVILRVRPFLYLGATFVFFGVSSMVWHAQTRIDQVWPWWAFGISLGLMLLGGLMAIEKNKGKLQTIAHTLSTWDA